MPKHAKPRLHGRDHEHGGADAALTHYDDVGGPGGGGTPVIPFSVFGTLTAQTGQLRWYTQNSGTITQVHASLGTPAAGGTGVTVQVNRNGSSVGTVVLTPGTSWATFTPSPATFAAGDFFTINITTIGSTTAGSDLVVQLRTG